MLFISGDFHITQIINY